ncbi:uncharacterized protein LOC120002658 [Tripterygium wilfordii]|uniref:uncharacterized protein LOC120002658 n=1 Tax=Tripterygium wilfordii TaxID=458696 RepID=UPI0018F84174|nr:uncharacterized protein LOC120002658 [Tripterygium wilfordii]
MEGEVEVEEEEVAYKPVREKKQIIFLPTSSFKEIPDYAGAPIENHKFYFKKNKEIKERLNNNAYVTDIIGFMYGMGSIEKVNVNGTSVDKLELKIDIERDCRMNTTLWADKANTFVDLISSLKKGPYVVVVTPTIVKKFMGEICLSSTSASKTYVNIDTQETREILAIFGMDQSSFMLLDAKIPSSLPLEQQMTENRKTINELTTMEPTKENNNSVIVTLEAMISENDQCKNNNFHSYKVELLVVDNTGETTLTMFDREVHQIIGVSATQLIGHYGVISRNKRPIVHSEISVEVVGASRDSPAQHIFHSEDSRSIEEISEDKPADNDGGMSANSTLPDKINKKRYKRKKPNIDSY